MRPASLSIQSQPIVNRCPIKPQCLADNFGAFPFLHHADGANAQRFQCRVIQFAGIIFSHAPIAKSISISSCQQICWLSYVLINRVHRTQP